MPISARQGSLQDVLLIITSTFILAIAVLFGHLILTKIQDNTTDEQIDQHTLQEGINALEVFDAGILLVNGFLWLTAILFAVRIPSDPVFAIPSFLFLVIAGWVSAEIANIFNLIVNVDPLSSTVNNFPLMFELFKQFPIIIGFMTLILIIALYAKIQSPRGTVVGA